MPTWNIFGRRGGYLGTAEGMTKEEVERFLRDEFGVDGAQADLKRPPVNPPNTGFRITFWKKRQKPDSK